MLRLVSSIKCLESMLVIAAMCTAVGCKPREATQSAEMSLSKDEPGRLEQALGIIRKFSLTPKFSGSIHSIASNSAGVVAVADNRGSLMLISESSEQVLAQVDFVNSAKQPGDASAMIFKQIGRTYLIALGQTDGTVSVGTWQEGASQVKLTDGQKLHSLAVQSFDLRVRGDSFQLVSGGEDGRLILWTLPRDLNSSFTLEAGKDITNFDKKNGNAPVAIIRVKFASTNSVLVAQGESVKVWDLLQEKVVTLPTKIPGAGKITALDFKAPHPSDCQELLGLVAIGSDNGSAGIFATPDELLAVLHRDNLRHDFDEDLVGKRQLRCPPAFATKSFSSVAKVHESILSNLKLSEDGRFVLAASAGGVVNLWESQSFKLLRQMGQNAATQIRVAELPDKFETGKVLFALEVSGNMYKWDLAKMNQPIALVKGPVTDTAASSDGQYLAFSDVRNFLTVYPLSTIVGRSGSAAESLKVNLAAPSESIAVLRPTISGQSTTYVVVAHCLGFASVFEVTNDGLSKRKEIGTRKPCPKEAAQRFTKVSASMNNKRVYLFSTLSPDVTSLRAYDFPDLKEVFNYDLSGEDTLASGIEQIQTKEFSTSGSGTNFNLPRYWFYRNSTGDVEQYLGSTWERLPDERVYTTLNNYGALVAKGRMTLTGKSFQKNRFLPAKQAEFFDQDQFVAALSPFGKRVDVAKVLELTSRYNFPIDLGESPKRALINRFAVLNSQLGATASDEGGLVWWMSDQVMFGP